jgi:DNA repair protein RecN (Recombination protein N)
MQSLAMAGSRLNIALLPCAAHAYGLEECEWQVAQHESLPLQALHKVASGGELSRISLAIQVITSQISAVPTLIFDEVDSGIGGRVAEIVGKLLRQLGQTTQVLCITHLPQVAACAQHQWQVSKHKHIEGVLSNIRALDSQERIEEIARMLGGEAITDITRRHAAEMLAA